MKTFIKQNFKALSMIVLAMLVMGLQSCYKRDYTIAADTNTFDNSNTVVSSIYGIVKDEAGMPLATAFVKTFHYTS